MRAMQSKETRRLVGLQVDLSRNRIGAPSHRYRKRSRIGNDALHVTGETTREKVCRGSIVKGLRFPVMLASVAVMALATIGSFPDSSARSNLKCGKGVCRDLKGLRTRSKKERNARKQVRRMRKGKRR
jgi:hypothetical protein